MELGRLGQAADRIAQVAADGILLLNATITALVARVLQTVQKMAAGMSRKDRELLLNQFSEPLRLAAALLQKIKARQLGTARVGDPLQKQIDTATRNAEVLRAIQGS